MVNRPTKLAKFFNSDLSLISVRIYCIISNEIIILERKLTLSDAMRARIERHA